MAEPITCPDCGRPRAPDGCSNVMGCMDSMRDQLAQCRATIRGQAALLARAREFALDVQQRVEVAIEDFCGEESADV